MIVDEAKLLLDPFVEKVNKDLVGFHKSQKTGYYSFYPYFEDFHKNLFEFGLFLEKKYEFILGVEKVGIVQAAAPFSKEYSMKLGHILFCVRIASGGKDDTFGEDLGWRGEDIGYRFYPDCIIRYRSNQKTITLYTKEQ